MALNIGEVIAARRKEKSWTQKHLANAVGVSVPAVSKWETGAACPDIALLSPIARALNITVDKLLSFKNELSDREAAALAEKAAGIYEDKGFDAGWKHCERLLREYPNSTALKFRLGTMFQTFTATKDGFNKQEIQGYYRRATNILEEVLAAGHPKFTFPATVILASFYIILEEPDRAEELLGGLPTAEADVNLLYSAIHTLRGKPEKAIKLVQENIKCSVSKISRNLSVLLAYANDNHESKTASAIAKINFDMANMFGVCRESAYPDMIKDLIAQGDRKKALNCLDEYVQYILDLSYDYSESPVFDRLAAQPADISYVKKVLAASILADEGYAKLKEEPRYIQIIDRLHGLANDKTHTFS